MMTTNVQLLCNDLDHLLKDICDFLANQINDENLTENQRLFANKLIHRSKKQLHQISKVSATLSTDVDDSSYVDMNKQSAPELQEPTYEEGESNEYLTPIDGCGGDLMNSEDPITCPYESLPAAELEKCEKYGHLDKKGRFLFIGHQKRLFAGVRDHWLLLYYTKKDLRPLENLNLMNFAAKPTEGVRTKTFELVCSRSQKALQFVAQTPKDMLQWVACINKKSYGKVEEVTSNSDETVEEENFYEPLKIDDEIDNDSNAKALKKSKPLPPLPSPNPQNTYIVRRSVPEAPPSDMEIYDPICVKDTPVNEDIEEIYAVIQNENPVGPKQFRKPPPPGPEPPRHPRLIETVQGDSSLTNSFSEDEEDALYDEPVVLVPARKRRPPDPEPEEEYSSLEPEEEYCNLVTLQSQNKIEEQPEEEYSNLSLISVDANKRTLPRPPLREKGITQITVEKQKDNEEDEEPYDCVVSTSVPLSGRDNQRTEGRLDLQKFKPKALPPVIQPKPQYLRRK